MEHSGSQKQDPHRKEKDTKKTQMVQSSAAFSDRDQESSAGSSRGYRREANFTPEFPL